MFSRYFLMLCAFGLFAGVVVSAVEAEVQAEQDNTEVEGRNPLLAIAVRAIAAAVRWAAKHCVEEAAKNCKQHWKNPKELVNCGRRFLEANKGRCVTG